MQVRLPTNMNPTPISINQMKNKTIIIGQATTTIWLLNSKQRYQEWIVKTNKNDLWEIIENKLEGSAKQREWEGLRALSQCNWDEDYNV